MISCRTVLRPLGASLARQQGASVSHAGLALSRYFPDNDDVEGRTHFYKTLSETKTIAPYRRLLKRWRDHFSEQETARMFVGTLATPLAVGLGLDSPTEVGIRTHHTYGTPVIPGSAIKGICMRAAKEWKTLNNICDTDFKAVMHVAFGSTESAGQCIFWDALYSQGKPMFSQDVLTVHHAHYYQDRGSDFPTDFDNPNPVPFLVTPPGTEFLFTVDAPPGWQEFVVPFVQWCLTEYGVGGKRNAGYGAFSSEWQPLPFPQVTKVILTERTLERTETGAIISNWNDADEANIVLSQAELAPLTVHWTEAQRANSEAFVTVIRRETPTASRIVRLNWEG